MAANGVLTALSASAGGTTQPVYLNAGTLTGISAVAVAYGGTGATTAAGARTNLDVVCKSGDTMTGKLTIATTDFGTQLIVEHKKAAYASVGFKNTKGVLGYIAMNSVNGTFYRYNSAASINYEIFDTSNYKNYTIAYNKLGSTNDYDRIVIALCETTAANTNKESYFKGSITYDRMGNGLIALRIAEVSFNCDYASSYGCNYSLFCNDENTSTSALSGTGYRACTFTYNGKTYAGIEFYQVPAAYVFITGFGNFTPFMIIYYNHNTSTIKNSEINNSINFTAPIRKNYYLVGDVKGNATYASSADNAYHLNSNTLMRYGWNGLNYFNINGTAGNAANTNDTPTTAWWHILRFNHDNNSGYYTDLAVPFKATSLYYKRIAGGTVQNGGWIKVLDALNYSDYALPRAGGTMQGAINMGTSNYLRVTMSAGLEIIMNTTGGWARGISYYHNDTYLTEIGVLGNGSTITHMYIGGTYNSPWFKVTPSGDFTSAGGATINGATTITGTVTGRSYWAKQASTGEIDIGVQFASGKNLYLYGNNSSTTRGLYDSTRGSIISISDSSTTFTGYLNGDISGRANRANYLQNNSTLGSDQLSYYQTSNSFYGNTGWCHYITASHGDGATYYHYMLGLPFWGPPKYQRQFGDTSNRSGWYIMWSNENLKFSLSGTTLTITTT